jgi:uncharacterized delta-60 repeat protein
MFSKAWRLVSALALVCGCLAATSGVAAAAPGDVDRSFGREGTVFLESGSVHFATPDDMAIGTDGQIYVLRTVQRCPTFSSCVIEHLVNRLRPNGTLDSGFGAGGVFVPIGGSLYSEDASLALPGDAGVIVAATDHGNLSLARLKPDGSLDGGFGAAGVAKFDLGTPVARVQVAVQGDGRILVGAEPESGYGGDAAIVARYTAQGAPDPSFNGGVPVVTSLGSGFGDFDLTGAGGIVLAGPRCCGAVGRAAHLASFDQVGHLEPNFGRGGELFVDDVTDGIGVGAIVVLPKGRIYVVGSGRGKGEAFVLALRPNGKLDPKYGHRGIAYIRRSLLKVAGAAVDRAGRLLIAGSALTGSSRGPGYGSQRLTVLRRLPDGSRDLTFAGGSLVRLRSLGATQVVAGELQKGRMLVALATGGSCVRACSSGRDFLVRFLGGTSASRCKGQRATIVGTRHGEKLTGTPHRDVIAALAGDDAVHGRGGDDLICGGRGDDRLLGGKGHDRLQGGPGRNRLRQ